MRLNRREFDLPEADIAYLESLGLPWETVRDGNNRWVIVHDWELCPGYSSQKISLGAMLSTGYPESQIDMVHVTPALSRADGKSIPSLSISNVCGERWQQWSRHRTSQKPWRIGVDDLSTHLSLVDHWFAREFVKRN